MIATPQWTPDELYARAVLRDLKATENPDYDRAPIRALARIALAQNDLLNQMLSPARRQGSADPAHASTHSSSPSAGTPGGHLIGGSLLYAAGEACCETETFSQAAFNADEPRRLGGDDGLTDAHRERADLLGKVMWSALALVVLWGAYAFALWIGR